jgi:diacylglycerol kinase (ATP)
MQEETLDKTIPSQAVGRRAIIIANPASGGYLFHASVINEAVAYLQASGWDITLRLTEREGDAQRLAREAVEEHLDVVIAAGGDGTINEVIQALAGSETALGVLPIGTVNVWAREVGIPLHGRDACDVLLHGQTRRIDLGQVNGRYFLLMAGIGLDGEVTHAVERKPFKRLGALGYLLIGTILGLGYPAFRVFMQIDGRVVKANAIQVVVGNTQLYGGTIKYTWQAKGDDGSLDICIVRRHSALGRIAIALDLLLHRKDRNGWTRYERCRVMKFRTKSTVAMQLDGDPAGYITPGFPPTTFTVAPLALKVIIPNVIAEDLFSKQENRPSL